MNTFSFKKLAAVACSAVTVLAMGAFQASAAGQIEMKGEEITLTLEELQAANYEVQWGVELINNPGYCNSGVGVTYGDGDDSNNDTVPSLEVVMKSGTTPKTKKVGAADLTVIAKDRPDADLVGWATNGADLSTDDGIILYFYFKVPETAQPGDKFPLTIDLDMLSTDQTNHFEQDTKVTNGFIAIAGGTTTEPTTTEPTTTEPTTTESTATESTTSESTTSSSSSSSDSTTTTTTTTTTSGKTTTTTTTSGKTTGTTTTTTGKGTATGDAGAGLAVAGMLAAAATAVVLRKKED